MVQLYRVCQLGKTGEHQTDHRRNKGLEKNARLFTLLLIIYTNNKRKLMHQQ